MNFLNKLFFWGATDPYVKFFRGVLTLVLIFALMVVGVKSCDGQDMYYEKCATMPALLSNWGIQVADIEYNSANWCHESNEQYYNGDGMYKILKYTTNIVSMGPLGAQPDMTSLYFDDCHYHWHLKLIDTKISDFQGNLLATGAKMGYDWVDSGNFNEVGTTLISDCRQSAIAQYDPLWVHPNLPPDDNYNSGNLGMTPGYEDTYTSSFDNNWVVLGHYDTLGNYFGIGEGDYVFHSIAHFDSLLDQGANLFPDEFSIGIRILNGLVTEIDLPDPGITPNAPTDINITKTSNPIVTWNGDADYFEVQPYIKKHGGNNQINKALNLQNVVGNSYEDFYSPEAPMLIFGNDKGWKVYYEIRAVNGSLKSEWVRSKDHKL